MRQAQAMELGGVWSRIARAGQVTTVRIGSLMCIPMLEGQTVTGWIVPFAGEPARMIAAVSLGGVPVWMVATGELDEMVPFEASLWGVGLATFGAGETINLVCHPDAVRPASPRACKVIAARGWRFPDEH